VASTVVVVGASLAGAVAAATLRQEGFDGDVVLVGAEEYPPYERPQLSKQYLRGEKPFEKLLVRPVSFYDDHRIDVMFGVRASAVEPRERSVVLQNGRRLRYDRLLLATGARNRRLPIPGRDLAGVLALRSVGDADAIRREIVPGRRAAVIGMGFIGSEVAASLRQAGVEVVGLEPFPAPLCRVLGVSIGRVLADVHREHGVETIFEDAIDAFEGDERVRRVVTKGGRRIDCDFAVVGLGVEPDVDWLAGSGLEVENGILVDELCRTSVDDVFAAGDVANHYHPRFGRRMRVEHWQNAMQQGAAAARAMLGRGQPYEPVHWFWSDQFDVNLQYAGFHQEWDRMVVRGSLEARSFLAFYLNHGRIDAIVAMNRGKDLRRAMPLIKARAALTPSRLEDESVDLRDLVPVQATGG
jgi:3-phenylpropionate/trans-cinnamate dioxygenase ferredoxin reductase subunit